MSQELLNLQIQSLDERSSPFSDMIVGKGNTILIKVKLEGQPVLVGIGSTANGELGSINTSIINETILAQNNSIGFSPYQPNITIIGGGEDFFGFVYKNEGIVIEDEVYTWGNNDTYQLGRGDKDSSGNNIITRQSGPGRVDISGVTFTGSSRIRTYQAGWNHSHVTTENNRVFSWGNNYYGQLGVTEGVNDASNTGIEPLEVPLDLDGEVPYSVYGGKDFSVVLTTLGNVYAYGINDCHQLCVSDNGVTDFCDTPIKIPIEDVVHISPGKSFVTALKRDGMVWGWGDDTYGQISLSSPSASARYINEPIEIPGSENAVYVSSGNNHSCILKKNGSLYIVGDNRFGQADPPGKNVNLVMGIAIANNTFYIEVDGDLGGYGAGIDNGSYLLGNNTNTTGSSEPISFLKPFINLNADVDLEIIYNNVLGLEYNLIPESIVREVIKYDEDQTIPFSEYLRQSQSVCFVKELAKKTNSALTDAGECCSVTSNTKPILRFRSLKEQLAYERGLFILDKKCLVKN